MDLNLQITLDEELRKAINQESAYTKLPPEQVVTEILREKLFSKAGKPRITGPASIGGHPLKKVTGPTTTNWK